MKKLIILLLIMIGGDKISHAQILIQATGPVDPCVGPGVGLEVMSPQPGYDYNWFIGGYGCPNVNPAFPIGFGASYLAMITGEFFCMGVPQGGGSPQISNPIQVRLLPGMPGSIYMPAPGIYGVNTTCVASASLCISAIYYQNWPGTIIQWYKNNVLISGASSGSYTATTEGYYKYSITKSSCITCYSDSTRVTIAPSAAITAGGSTTICSGNTVQLNANTVINAAYQWKNNGNNIPGATTQSYNATSAGSYTVVVTNTCGTATSSAVVVTVNPLPSATITPAGPTTFCSGGTVQLNANTVINALYQWINNGNNISGATGQSYNASSAGSYTVVITNTCGTATSSTVAVTVNPLPSATITPAGPTTFCSGGSVVLNAPVSNNRSYQWKKAANLISGATLSFYTATTGGKYKVIVTNTITGCSKTTNSATVVTVNALPTATITPQGPTTFCAGGSVVLAANIGAGLTYKWKKGASYIPGATLTNYTATTGGNYKVEVTNSNGCSKTSANVSVTVPCREGEEITPATNFNVSVFPNPACNEINIILPVEDNYEIEIVSTLGERVIKSQNQNRIDISKLKSGVYLIKVVCKEHIVTQKFIKE